MAISAQIAALQNQLTTQLSNMNLGVTKSIPATPKVVHQALTQCEVCRSNDHTTDASIANTESVNNVKNTNQQGQQNFSNTYNPNWQNHPNFSQGRNQAHNANQYHSLVGQNQQ